MRQNRKPVHRKVEDEEEGGANERKGGERGGGWIGVARVASTVLRTCSRSASSSGVCRASSTCGECQTGVKGGAHEGHR